MSPEILSEPFSGEPSCVWPGMGATIGQPCSCLMLICWCGLIISCCCCCCCCCWWWWSCCCCCCCCCDGCCRGLWSLTPTMKFFFGLNTGHSTISSIKCMHCCCHNGLLIGYLYTCREKSVKICSKELWVPTCLSVFHRVSYGQIRKHVGRLSGFERGACGRVDSAVVGPVWRPRCSGQVREGVVRCVGHFAAIVGETVILGDQLFIKLYVYGDARASIQCHKQISLCYAEMKHSYWMF